MRLALVAVLVLLPLHVRAQDAPDTDWCDECIIARESGRPIRYTGPVQRIEIAVCPEPEPVCAGDMDGDGVVGLSDVRLFNAAIGTACGEETE